MWFGNQDQQGVDANRIVTTATALLPSYPDLHRVFEAELAWDLIGQQSGLGHQQPDQMIGRVTQKGSDPLIIRHILTLNEG